MITLDSITVAAAHFGSRAVEMISYGGRMVWYAIRSCFGAGYWDNTRKWDNNTEGWKN